MTTEELVVLAQRVKDETATPEEELALLKHLNQGVTELRAFVKEVMSSNN